MIAAPLLVALLVGQVPDAGSSRESAALIEQLGASRYADRKAAAEAIERIGRSALPALRTFAIRATRRSGPAPAA